MDGSDAAKEKHKRLTWKKEDAETGLRRVGAGPRGSKLHDGATTYARVSALGDVWSSERLVLGIRLVLGFAVPKHL
jgi:hypothetical protein